METQMPTPQRLKAIVLNGGGHAFDTKTGRSFSVNPTAQVVLLMMQDGASRDMVVEALIGLCTQPSSVVEAGIDTFMEQMARYAS
jgi:hypothetical protein